MKKKKRDKFDDDIENSNYEDYNVDDFLNKIRTDDKKNYSYRDYYSNNKRSINDFSIDDFDKIFVDYKTQNKIDELKEITSCIEKNVVKHSHTHVISKKFKIDYPNLLNKQQFIAASFIEGPILVIAGAGSGKTRTVTFRVSFLLENNIQADSILLLTFTRKAANEMKNRVTELLGDKRVNDITAGTFHSFSNYVLRRYSGLLGISPNFLVIDTADSEDIIDLIRQEIKINKTDKFFPGKARIIEIISKAKNCSLSIDDVIEKYFTGLFEAKKEIKIIANAYEKYKRLKMLFDFDDLMEMLLFALKENHEFRNKLHEKYKYIMVDEFQDTNIIQKEIVDQLSGKYRNIMVVGDDSQSIYSFRGANFENILRFPQTYPDCRVIKLEENYRSNQGILDFINSISKNAELSYEKALYSTNNKIFKPKVKKFYSQIDEAVFIVDKILELRERNIPLDNIAVVYRATYHSNFIQAELTKRNIPYVVVGGIKFVERRHVKDVIAYLRIMMNPLDAVSWNRVLKLLAGIGNITAAGIVNMIALNKSIINFDEYKDKKFYGELDDLEKLLHELSKDTLTIADKIDAIKKYYTPILKNIEKDYINRLQDIDVLYQLALKYDDLEKFLSDFALDPPRSRFQDRNIPMIDESEDKPLTLTTVHSAKGLEWHTVFVCHLLDGLFPSIKSVNSFEEVEEERRLYYVACSRAKEELYLTMPSYFYSYEGHFTMPSRFLIEVDKDLYEEI